MRELFGGHVRRCLAGYHWEDIETPGRDRLVPSLGEHEEDRKRFFESYDPFAEAPGLFLLFSELEIQPEPIAEFAGKYGTVTWQLVQKQPKNVIQGMWSWRRKIEAMRDAINLWRAIEEKDEKALIRHVMWIGESSSRTLDFPSPLVQIRHPRTGLSPIAEIPSGKWKEGDLVGPAQFLLDGVIACKASWQSVNLVPKRTIAGLTYRVVLDEFEDVIWAQFAVAVAENQEFRRCPICGQPFELLPGVHRRDKTTCSAACRQTMSRQRRREARQLRAAGHSLQEIKKAMEAKDTATVKRWLGEK